MVEIVKVKQELEQKQRIAACDDLDETIVLSLPRKLNAAN